MTASDRSDLQPGTLAGIPAPLPPSGTFFSQTVNGARSASRRYPRELWRSLTAAPAWMAAHPQSRTAIEQLLASRFGAAWLGHATTLLRMEEDLILTDPVLSDRIGPRIAGRSFGLGRLRPAPLGPSDIPAPNILLLSHAHFDHLDRPTLRELASPHTTVITAAGTRGLVPRGFKEIHELPWGESISIGGVCISALKPAHWGARTAVDRARGYNSYLIQSRGGREKRVLFGGDTAATNAFNGLRVDLAIMGIGGYKPWEHAHATPEQVWSMVERMRADRLLPMHHSTFPLSEEPVQEPLERLLGAAGTSAGRVSSLEHGTSFVE